MKIGENKVVALDYKVYDADTKELLEDTAELGPYYYIQGMGLFLPKIEAALDSKSKGYKTTIEIPMEEAYGDYDEELVEELTKADFADFEDIYEGMEFVVELEDGSEMVAVITEIDGDKVYTDSNHPFSGRNLLFEVEVTDVREATDEELNQRMEEVAKMYGMDVPALEEELKKNKNLENFKASVKYDIVMKKAIDEVVKNAK